MSVINHLEFGVYSVLESVEAVINNCTDEVWETKVGGDYYWNQVYHALIATIGMLEVKGSKIEYPIKSAGNLDGKEKLSEAHTREIVKNFLPTVKVNVKSFFASLTEEQLYKELDFYGSKMPLINIIIIAISHVMYHVGACDAALRDNGLKASM